MSELSTVRCDRALGLWIAGTRASSVDGELPWRSSGRVAAVASIGLGTDGGDVRRRRLGPYCGRGGDGRRAASRAVRRPRRERRLGPRRGGENLPAREILAVFSKPATYPGYADPPKPRTGSSSTWRHHSVDFESKKETPPSRSCIGLLQTQPV